MKKVYYDLETTGTNPGKHGIHQISGIIEIDGLVVEEFDFKVRPNPKALVEAEALAVAGVTQEQIMAYPQMVDVFVSLTSTLSKYVDKFDKNDKFFLVGYNNSQFDNQFLRGFFLQNGDKFFGSWFWSNTMDVMVLATYALDNEIAKMENFKLKTVAKHLGIVVDESKLHDAVYDCYLTREIESKITVINNLLIR